jgi:tetrahydromethanopterin S-methyltransferase subunit A
VFDQLNSVGLDAATPYKTEKYTASEFASKAWPVQPGNYLVFSPTQSVAVALLEGVSLSDLSGVGLAALAMAGTITTENLGVEHLVKNLIANPHVRHLVLFGTEIQGHYPGDALLRVHEDGTDPKGRIIGARGARPVLKNLTQLEIEQFKSQVHITSLIGKTDLPMLVARVAELANLDPAPYKQGLRVDLVEAKRAEPARRLKLDKAGYFVVMVMAGRPNPLVVEHYSNDGVLRNVIEGSDAATLCATIVDLGLVSEFDHAAYIGRELAKAEVALNSGTRYVQDKAQGHSERCDECG